MMNTEHMQFGDHDGRLCILQEDGTPYLFVDRSTFTPAEMVLLMIQLAEMERTGRFAKGHI
jgi:hypothetical protein